MKAPLNDTMSLSISVPSFCSSPKSFEQSAGSQNKITQYITQLVGESGKWQDQIPHPRNVPHPPFQTSLSLVIGYRTILLSRSARSLDSKNLTFALEAIRNTERVRRAKRSTCQLPPLSLKARMFFLNEFSEKEDPECGTENRQGWFRLGSCFITDIIFHAHLRVSSCYFALI